MKIGKILFLLLISAISCFGGNDFYIKQGKIYWLRPLVFNGIEVDIISSTGTGIDFGGKYLRNVSSPIANSDVATKYYIDITSGAIRTEMNTGFINVGVSTETEKTARINKDNLLDSATNYLTAVDGVLTALGLSIAANQISTYTMLTNHSEWDKNIDMLALWHLNNGGLWDFTGNGYNLANLYATQVSSLSWKLNTSSETFYSFGNNNVQSCLFYPPLPQPQTTIFNVDKSSEITISFWTKANIHKNGINYVKLFSYGAYGQAGWEVLTDTDSYRLTIAFNTPTGNSGIFYSTRISTMNWTHVAYTINLYNGQAKEYTNGNLTETNNSIPVYYSTTAILCIGGVTQNRTSGYNCFEGIMDEIGIWRRVLSDNEIKAYYDLGQTKYKTNGTILPVVDYNGVALMNYVQWVSTGVYVSPTNSKINIAPIGVVSIYNVMISNVNANLVNTYSYSVYATSFDVINASLTQPISFYWRLIGTK